MKYLKRFIYEILEKLITIPYNIYSKTKDLLNPAFYSPKLRIIKKINGKIHFQSKQRAIFVLYQNTEIPFSVINVLKTLKLLKINCTISVNEELGHEKIDQLSKECDLILVRKNFGMDFAAYKDSILQTNLEELDKLIILNDSLFYFQKGLTNIFEQLLDKNYDVVALTENLHVRKWHLQSFLLSFNKNVFLNKNFTEYWKQYKALNNRKHVVTEGEILFSQKVLKPYYRNTKIIYSLDTIIESIKNNKIKNPDILFNLLPNSSLETEYIPKNNTSALLNIHEKGNITHTGAFILPHFYKGTVIKKDIVYKKSFSLHEALEGFISLGVDENEYKTAYQDLKVRGNTTQLNTLDYLLTLLGAK